MIPAKTVFPGPAPLRRRRPGSARRRREALEGYLFALPWLLGFFLFTAGPMLVSILMSLTEWNGITPISQIRWVGGENYRRLFTDDPRFLKALANTAWYVAFAVPLGTLNALGLALLLNQDVKGQAVFRTLFYLPSVVSGVATSMMWLWLFNPSFGPINYLLRKLGVPESALPGWLTDPAWALKAFVFMAMWEVGNAMLIYLAGLQGVPSTLYEAADLDGASPWVRFRHVTLPLVTPTILFNVIMGVIGSFQTFTHAFIMTGGGPKDSTLFFVLYLYQKAFQQFQMGYASAMAWVLFVILMGFTLILLATSRRWVYYEGDR
ncbi:MAG TPA: sugar ABC transporter permease [bacterium]|nr:sugar ABC transporter permease [bacterium]